MKKFKRIRFIFLLFSFIFLTIGCSRKNYYSPINLRKLTKVESMDRNLNGIPPAIDVKYKDKSGKELSQDELTAKLKNGKYFMDEYVDEEGVVKEFVIREVTKSDKAWLVELLSLIHI